jgi:uncharacterized protein DUF4019
MARHARCGHDIPEIVTRGRRLFAQAALALFFAWQAGIATAQDATATAVQQIAREWLALVDRGDAAASHAGAAARFRNAITRERWTDALTVARAPFGALEQRSVLSTTFEKTFPGAPDGSYASVLFRTSFAKKVDGRETVTLEREADGAWRVVGYLIQ